MTDNGTAALRIEHVVKRFGDFTALSNVSLTIGKGELVCFLGPSGCGKTTLLRIIAGLEVQTRGAILQNGRDISRLPPMMRDYGIVFQSYALFPNLTIFDNVAYGLVNRRLPKAQVRARVAELLTLIGLADSGAKYPGQLSGGQQQRIALARALATSPGLLLLDEPLSALDAQVRVRLRGEIRQLQQRLGVTTILVTHDQEEALSIGDRVVVMNQGVIEQIGSPLEIYREPASPFVADFVGKVNLMLAAVARGDAASEIGGIAAALRTAAGDLRGRGRRYGFSASGRRRRERCRQCGDQPARRPHREHRISRRDVPARHPGGRASASSSSSPTFRRATWKRSISSAGGRCA